MDAAIRIVVRFSFLVLLYVATWVGAQAQSVVAIGFERAVISVTEGIGASVEVCASIRDGSLERAVMIAFFTTDSTATSVDPTDYTAVSVEMTFSTGTTRNCQDILIEDDDILEGTENLFANLTTSDPDVTLEPNVTEIVVSEDQNDGVTIGFDPVTYSVNEGLSLEVCACVIGALEIPVAATIRVRLINGEEEARTDFVKDSVDLTFTPSEPRQCRNVTTVEDNYAENDEDFLLSLRTRQSGVTLDPDTATIILNDDDSILQVQSNIDKSIPLSSYLGQTVELHCSFESSPVLWSYSTLQWMDGELPIQNSSSRKKLIVKGLCGLTLQIHNFSILDYGIYKCRCFNLYNYWEIPNLPIGEVIYPYCSQPSDTIELLPNNLLTIESVKVSNMEIHALEQYYQRNNTIMWTKVNQSTSEEWLPESVTVSSAADRGKFVCHDGTDTVHSIVYISIKDYLPSRMLHISPDETTLFLSELPTISTHICAAFTPFTGSSKLQLFVIDVNDTQSEKMISTIGHSITSFDNLDIAGNIGVLTNFNVTYLQIFFLTHNTTLISDFFQRKQFRCVINSPWEQPSVTFAVSINTSVAEIRQLPASTTMCPPPMVTSSPQPVPSHSLPTQQSYDTSVTPETSPLSSILTTTLSTITPPPAGPVLTMSPRPTGGARLSPVTATISVVLVTAVLVIAILSLCILSWRKHNNERKDSDGSGCQNPFARLTGNIYNICNGGTIL